MKILHIIGGGDVGGAKTHVLSLLSRLKEKAEITLICLRHGDFAEDAKKLGINTRVIADKNVLTVAKKVAEMVRAEGYEIVHSHGAKANLTAAFVKRKVKVKLVSTIHSDYRLDYMDNPLKQITFGLMNAVSLRSIDYYTVVSDAMANTLIKRNFNPQAMYTVYNGIDYSDEAVQCSKEQAAEKYGIEYEKDCVYIGIAARLCAIKDVKTLLNAAATAVKKNDKLRFIIGGDGEERKSLEKLAKTLELDKYVSFIGWVSDMSSFFSLIDVHVMTSLSEGFPYALLEGAAAKKATVSTAVGGIPALIDSGVNGFLFMPGENAALAEKLVFFAENPEKTKLFGERLYEKARKCFNMEKMCESQLALYEKILANAAMGKPQRVCICGSYGIGNSGDEAILSAIIEDIRSVTPNADITVMSRRPKITKAVQRVHAIHSFDIPRVFFRLLRSDVFVNGGGNLIQDITSTRSIIFYLFTIRLAKLCGANVIMYGCGIGPITKTRNRKLAAKVLNKSVCGIALREERAFQELSALGVTKPEISVGADPAVNLHPADEQAVDAVLIRAGLPEQKLLGISVRDWKNAEETAKSVAFAADHACEKYGFVPVFIPMHTDDVRVSESIARMMKNKAYVISEKCSVDVTIGIIGKMDYILGMRLHSLIFASSRQVPAVGIAYDVKALGFMRSIKSELCIPVEQINGEKLCQMLDTLFATRKKCDETAKETVAALQQAAHMNLNIYEKNIRK